MKRSVLVVLVLLLSMGIAFADEYEGIYDLIVPTNYGFLTINGGLGSAGGTSASLYNQQNLIEVNAATGTFTFNVDANGNYSYYNQDETTELDLDAAGSVMVGTTNGISFTPQGDYTSYGLDINGLKGFWTAGGWANVNASTTSFTFSLFPTAGIGLGRQYNIANIYRAKLMMEYLGVTPTPEKVKAVVTVFENWPVISSRFTEDYSKDVREYWQKMADAMGIPNRVADVMTINNSQLYAYERARTTGMEYGWQAMLRANLQLEKFTTFSFGGSAGPVASIAGFVMDDALYYEADADASVTYSSSTVGLNANAGGEVIFLPDDYHWWVEAIADINLNIIPTFALGFDVSGAGHYLLNPNFETYAGLRLDDTAGFTIFAGGEIRIW